MSGKFNTRRDFYQHSRRDYTKGLEKMEPSRAMIIAFVEPLTAAVAGVIAFDETMSLIKISGMRSYSYL